MQLQSGLRGVAVRNDGQHALAQGDHKRTQRDSNKLESARRVRGRLHNVPNHTHTREKHTGRRPSAVPHSTGVGGAATDLAQLTEDENSPPAYECPSCHGEGDGKPGQCVRVPLSLNGVAPQAIRRHQLANHAAQAAQRRTEAGSMSGACTQAASVHGGGGEGRTTTTHTQPHTTLFTHSYDFQTYIVQRLPGRLANTVNSW